MESPVIFNIYLDFVLRCAEKTVLEKYPNTGLSYSYRIPNHCSNREQRSISGLSGLSRMRMLLYADDIVLLCSSIEELQEIVCIYNTFLRFGLKISSGKTKTMAFNVSDEIYIYIFFLFNTYHEFGTMYEDKHTPLLSANLCAQQIMAASP